MITRALCTDRVDLEDRPNIRWRSSPVALVQLQRFSLWCFVDVSKCDNLSRGYGVDLGLLAIVKTRSESNCRPLLYQPKNILRIFLITHVRAFWPGISPVSFLPW